MNNMNVFQQVWRNFETYCTRYHSPEVARTGKARLNELNQAVFAKLEKILPSNVKVRSVTAPAFIYYTEAAGGYGVDTHSASVQTRNIKIADGTLEEQIDSVVAQLVNMIEQPCVRTAFFYMPVYPIDDRGHAFVRLMTTGETVDLGHQLTDINT